MRTLIRAATILLALLNNSSPPPPSARQGMYRKLIERKQDESVQASACLYESAWGNSKRSIRSILHSRHTVGLEIFAGLVLLALLALAVMLIVSFVNAPPETDTKVSEFLLPAVFIAAIQFIHATGSKRRGAVDMITSEIITVARVLAAGNIIGAFIATYAKLEATGDRRPSGFGDVARKENYFTAFDKNIETLGTLKRELVMNITAFYTFMKAARDATGAINLWKDDYPVSRSKDDVVDIIYLCFLNLLHGHFAITALIEKDQQQRLHYAEDVFTGLEIQCFVFLMLVLADDDFRYKAVQGREERYRELACRFGYKKLIAMLDEHV